MSVRLLELFCGTKSVGKEAIKMGWDVVSLDSNPRALADITCAIEKWDFHNDWQGEYPDVIWASPPCTQFSFARTTGGPRDYATADAAVLKVFEIVEYFKQFKPDLVWWIENPVGHLQRRTYMLNLPHMYIVSYCMYDAGTGIYTYRKNTCLWTNCVTEFTPKRCRKGECGHVVDNRHLGQICSPPAGSKIKVKPPSLNQKYSIPPALVRAVLQLY